MSDKISKSKTEYGKKSSIKINLLDYCNNIDDIVEDQPDEANISSSQKENETNKDNDLINEKEITKIDNSLKKIVKRTSLVIKKQLTIDHDLGNM